MTEKLLDVAALAELLGCSERGVWRWRDSGRLPAPVTLGRLVRWREGDIQAWIQAGCPDVRRTRWTPPAAGCGCGGKGGCHA
ncbi:MAG: helix-turn-helix domain-containing protein [Candidatus Hydrogenedens sp.]|nr:helix-turn-helix domain-containing protein [Candidatus Hydrogenedentota bacterium]NLF57644.1 helix-turn-helix domain-containing protein [Candidatus Hydrogenedens sp.]